MSTQSDNVEKVNDFLNKAGVWNFITLDGNQPQGRPFGYHELKDGVIYFGTGTFKSAYQQLKRNPKVEVLAVKGGEFMRYDGVAVTDDDEAGIAMGKAAVEASPIMSKIYNDETGNRFGIFHLEQGHVVFRDGAGETLDEFDL